MASPTINHSGAVDRFRALLQADSPHRLMRLTGSTKLGKSHLMRKTFVEIAHEEGIPVAELDLRQATQGAKQHLHQLAAALEPHFDLSAYRESVREAATPPYVSISRVLFVRSQTQISASTDPWDVICRLTMDLADGLSKDDGRALVLVDAVDQASEDTLQWMGQSLLTELCRLPQVRVVVAGRTLPEPASSYARSCVEHQLDVVHDAQEYIEFCAASGFTCPASSIPDLAKAFMYTPGLFVEAISVAFAPGA